MYIWHMPGQLLAFFCCATKKWLLFAIMKKHVNSRVWHQPLCPGEIHPRKRRHLCDIPIPWPKGFSKFHLNGNSPPELPPSRAPEANHPWSCHNTRTCPLGQSKPQKNSRPWVWRGAFPSISFHSWICWRGIRNYGGTRWISQKKQGKKQFSLIFWVDKNIKTQISKVVSFFFLKGRRFQGRSAWNKISLLKVIVLTAVLQDFTWTIFTIGTSKNRSNWSFQLELCQTLPVGIH